MVLFGHGLDLVISEVFSNLIISVILFRELPGSTRVAEQPATVLRPIVSPLGSGTKEAFGEPWAHSGIAGLYTRLWVRVAPEDNGRSGMRAKGGNKNGLY